MKLLEFSLPGMGRGDQASSRDYQRLFALDAPSGTMKLAAAANHQTTGF
jgi:hypothetical protein